MSDHWRDHARQWELVRPPLRPCAEDVAITRRAVADWLRIRGIGDPATLVLGVTPELCEPSITPGRGVLAVDHSFDMIRALWRGPSRRRDRAIRADWRSLPLAARSIDLVLADGSLTLLAYPTGYAEVLAELTRVMRAGGRCVIRCFAQLETPETTDSVFADLSTGAIGSFHVLKWRLAMALQADLESGVAVGSVWETLHARWDDLEVLAERSGWPIGEVRTIEAYRNVPARYTFPTVAEYQMLLARAEFRVLEVVSPSYELGDRCPTLIVGRLQS